MYLSQICTHHHLLIMQLNLTGRCHGLSVEETKDLWVQADVDGNGLDYKEFQVSKNLEWLFLLVLVTETVKLSHISNNFLGNATALETVAPGLAIKGFLRLAA